MIITKSTLSIVPPKNGAKVRSSNILLLIEPIEMVSGIIDEMQLNNAADQFLRL